MVAYSFKKQFVAPIKALTKGQTIRANRKRHARPGETLQLYTAMRTKHCTLIGTATCFTIQPIRIDIEEAVITVLTGKSLITLTGLAAVDAFARRDGFEDWFEMRDFWRVNHKTAVFCGVLIRWTNFREPNQ